MPLDEAIAFSAVVVIISVSGGRTLFWVQSNNSKTGRDRPYACRPMYWPLIGTHGWAIESAHHHVLSITTKTESRNVSLSNCSQMVGDRRQCKKNTFENTLFGSEVIQWTMERLSPNPQMSEVRSSKIFAMWWWPCSLLFCVFYDLRKITRAHWRPIPVGLYNPILLLRRIRQTKFTVHERDGRAKMLCAFCCLGKGKGSPIISRRS